MSALDRQSEIYEPSAGAGDARVCFAGFHMSGVMQRDQAIRVLLIDTSVGFGGATKSAGMLSRAVEGVESIVFTSQEADILRTWYSHIPSQRHRRLFSYRNKWRFLSWASRFKTGAPTAVAGRLFAVADDLAFPWYLLHVVSVLIRERVDLIHLQNGFYPLEAFLAGRLLSLPVIVHLRGFSSGATPRTFGAQLGIIGDSNAVLNSVPAGMLAAVPNAAIYEPVDVQAFESTRHLRADVRRRLGLEEGHRAVGIFGRVVPWKGQREFVLALERAIHLEERLRGFVVGGPSDGGAEYLQEVKRLAERSTVRDKIRFVDYTDKVEPLYHAMDVVVHASVDPEPCGMVVLEAMAARKGVIASSAGGPMEIISDGEDGCLVAPGNIEALAEAMVSLGSNDRLRLAMGDRAFEKVRCKFSTGVAARNLERFYARVIAEYDAIGRGQRQ